MIKIPFLTLMAVYGVIAISRPVHAGHVSIQHKPETGEILLVADTCQALKSEVEAILAWTRSRGENPPEISIDCNKSPSQNTVDIAPLIPSRVRQIYGKFPACRGPNCSNHALYESKLVPSQRYCSESEWHNFLKEFCRMRSSSESPRPGDLVAIREQASPGGPSSSISYAEVHGFTYVGELSCTKNGNTPGSACEIAPFKDILKEYDLTDEKCINPTELQKKDCKVFLNYYKCKKIPLIFEDKTIKKVDSNLSSCTQSGVFEKSHLDELANDLDDLAEKSRSNPLIKSVVESYRLQLEILQFENAYRRIETEKDLESLISLRGLSHESLLHTAAQRGDLKKVQLLLEKKAKVNLLDEYKNTPLYLAAREGHTKIVEEILKAMEERKMPPEVFNPPKANGYTPLHAAVHNNDAETVELILSTLVRVKAPHSYYNPPNEQKLSPLFLAIKKAKINIVLKLLAGMKKGGIDLAKEVLKGSPSALILAIHVENAEILEALVREGKIDLNQKVNGLTLLTFASLAGKSKSVEFLAAKQGVIEQENASGAPALSLAISEGDAQIAQILIKAGADLRKVDPEIIKKLKDPEMLKLLGENKK